MIHGHQLGALSLSLSLTKRVLARPNSLVKNRGEVQIQLPLIKNKYKKASMQKLVLAHAKRPTYVFIVPTAIACTSCY